jgi:lipoyl(octanoyl) transferase
MSLVTVDLGRTSYGECWELQRRTFAMRSEGRIPDHLLLTEHDPVYTIGRSGTEHHLLAREEELQARGVSVWHNDRGGDITYHGPGQLVGYPILDLGGYYRDLHRYLRDLEEVIIRSLAGFGIHGGRIPEYTGVWVGDKKICAIGIKSSRWITMHGFALNITTDLSFFERIIPCGIFEKGVTSMEQLLEHPVPAGEVKTAVAEQFGRVFGTELRWQSPGEFLSLIGREDVSGLVPAISDALQT